MRLWQLALPLDQRLWQEAVFAVSLFFASSVIANDNELSDDEQQAGWQLLFNGTDLTGWKCNNGKPYDLVSTTRNMGKETGEWNTVEVRCYGSYIQVKVNGEQVAAMSCDKFDQPGVCPDGEQHKYKLNGEPRAVKDFARVGYLGFQDHGHKVWYKNVKLLKLELPKYDDDRKDVRNHRDEPRSDTK